MRVILAAMGVAVLASPVMAQTWSGPQVPVWVDNVFWGQAYAPLQGGFASGAVSFGAPAYGSVAGPRGGRPVPGVVVPARPVILDCVHVTFPQCGGTGGGG
jgi:hypothetical protein